MIYNFSVHFKVVCGTPNGVLLVWSWGAWGDCGDRFPGFPPDISALELVDEDTVVLGGSDGLLYVAQLQPNAIMGKLGGNGNNNSRSSSNLLLPVERLAFSGDHQWLGWVSHDEKIRFLDAASLRLDVCGGNDSSSSEEEDEESSEEHGGSSSEPEGREGHERSTASTKHQRIETDDLSHSHGSYSDSDDDSDDGSDDSENNPYSSVKQKKHNTKKQYMNAAEQFFSDL